MSIYRYIEICVSTQMFCFMNRKSTVLIQDLQYIQCDILLMRYILDRSQLSLCLPGNDESLVNRILYHTLQNLFNI